MWCLPNRRVYTHTHTQNQRGNVRLFDWLVRNTYYVYTRCLHLFSTFFSFRSVRLAAWLGSQWWEPQREREREGDFCYRSQVATVNSKWANREPNVCVCAVWVCACIVCGECDKLMMANDLYFFASSNGNRCHWLEHLRAPDTAHCWTNTERYLSMNWASVVSDFERAFHLPWDYHSSARHTAYAPLWRKIPLAPMGRILTILEVIVFFADFALTFFSQHANQERPGAFRRHAHTIGARQMILVQLNRTPKKFNANQLAIASQRPFGTGVLCKFPAIPNHRNWMAQNLQSNKAKQPVATMGKWKANSIQKEKGKLSSSITIRQQVLLEYSVYCTLQFAMNEWNRKYA